MNRFDQHFETGEYDLLKYWSMRAKEAKEKGVLINAVCTFHKDDKLRFIRNKVMDCIQKKVLADFLSNENMYNKQILEVGCGIGRWVNFFKDKKSNYVGIDISEEMIEIAKKNFKEVVFKTYNPQEGFPFDEECFDYVFSITVLHHNPYNLQEKVIKEIYRVLKFKGKVFILEDIKGQSFNMFPNSLEGWVNKFKKAGLKYKRHRLLRYFIVTTAIKKFLFLNKEIPSLYYLSYLDPHILKYINLPKNLYTTALIEFQKL